MSTYYCHTCAISDGILNPAEPTTFTGTNYQLEKYIKHTAPVTNYHINSIFKEGPDYEAYENYIVSTTASGSVEIDNQGRTNLILVAGRETGYKKVNGVFKTTTIAVKVVLHDNEYQVHGYPYDSSVLEGVICSTCGCLIPY